jgi:N-acetylmuramoyl-L-alanine amidase-like protein
MPLKALLTLALTLGLAACSYQHWSGPFYFDQPLTNGERLICEDLSIDPDVLSDLKGRPIHTFEPRELDIYLRYARRAFPDIRDRLAHLGRKNIGQSYDIYLLGEFPYEIYDEEPTFNLEASDCVVFSEHTYAMTLAHDWASFYRILQRLRYMDGEVGILTRNHWTLANWDVSNDWLIEDVTTELGDGEQWAELHQTRRPSIFFMRRFGLGADMPDVEHTFTYIPLENFENVIDELDTGDFVNIIRGTPEAGWAGHTGLITRDPDGSVYFLHSTPPRVRQQSLRQWVEAARERNVRYAADPPTDWNYHPTIGLKFLRFRADELSEEFAVAEADLILPVPDRDFGKDEDSDERIEWVGEGSSTTASESSAEESTSQPTSP